MDRISATRSLHSLADRVDVDGLVFCVDYGASYIKTLLQDKSGSVARKYKYEDFPYANIGRMVSLNDAGMVLTGARASEARLADLPEPKARYSEIDCLAQLAPALGYDRAVVACVGTGTPFVVYDRGKARHAGGTGVGGGTFQGLSSRMLGVNDPYAAEQLAEGGVASRVNMTVGDLYPSGTSYLRSDFTAANFAKSVGGRPRDVAMGIHSLVAEVVGMMAAQIAMAGDISQVIFCGGACENRIICDTLADCASVFGISSAFVEEPGFGTCHGAISKYVSELKQAASPESA